MAWDTNRGFYISPIQLDAPWEQEVKAITTGKGEHLKPVCTQGQRNFDEKITWASFKSKDGKVDTKPARADRGELEKDFIWTSLYYNNPVLKSVIDWFPVDKTRVRIGRTFPGAYIGPHFDWDNQRLGYNANEQIVRIWVQLDDCECWYRLTNGIDDITVTLKKGQFIILNVDTVVHQTETLSEQPRSNLLIHAKVNHWVRCLPDLFTKHRLINPLTEEPQ